MFVLFKTFSRKTKKPIPSMLKIWVFYFIEKIGLPPILMKIITLKNFTFFTIEDFVKQLQAGLLAPGSFYWSLLPGKPFKRLFQWRCDVRPRLQRRVRSSPQILFCGMDSLFISAIMRNHL
uniref:Uncharacterized protein n=1 Tax=Kuenenia stuttgartiensis TaxID=174633 RepID=Q1Q389_KUEST|nr:unknown protein [Candidatus Kuenenia stuttgartiensis]